MSESGGNNAAPPSARVGRMLVRRVAGVVAGLAVGLAGAVWPVTPATAAPNDPARAVARIDRETAALETLNHRILEAEYELRGLPQRSQVAKANYLAALSHRSRVRRDVDAWARGAYIAHAPRERLDGFRLAPDGDTPAEQAKVLASASSRRTAALRGADRDALAAYRRWRTILTRQRALSGRLAGDRDQLAKRAAVLSGLRERYADALARRASSAATSALAEARRRLPLGDRAAATALALRAARVALAQLGKPYVFGDEGPDTFDCSGLVQYAYRLAGVALPRTARPQYLATRQIRTSDLRPGDLLFFATDRNSWNTIHHVGIYLGGGRMVHAPQPGDRVRVAPVWWAEYFGATRVVR